MTLPIQLPYFEGNAACAEVDGDAWFPEKGFGAREQKRICNSCEIQQQCLLWAISNGELFGVWGGLTAHERRRLGNKQRQPRPIHHGTDGGNAAHRRRGEKPCESCRAASVRVRHENAARRAGAA